MGKRLDGNIAIVTGAGCIGPGWGNGRASAVRFAEEGAQVFAVDRDLASVRETVERAGGDVELLLKQRLERIPMGFAGDGRDTANVALFLASDDSRWVTGTEIVVDGGMSARCD
jgi:NAD(P)-dependent dehydrogenase (short-subunit alcohol dehydrogenase family)